MRRPFSGFLPTRSKSSSQSLADLAGRLFSCRVELFVSVERLGPGVAERQHAATPTRQPRRKINAPRDQDCENRLLGEACVKPRRRRRSVPSLSLQMLLPRACLGSVCCKLTEETGTARFLLVDDLPSTAARSLGLRVRAEIATRRRLFLVATPVNIDPELL